VFSFGVFMSNQKMTMGLIVGNRGFFPDHLAKSGREEMLRVLTAAGIDVVALTPEESKYGALETRDEVRRCAELFKKNRERINGIIVTLPNFGEERAGSGGLDRAEDHRGIDTAAASAAVAVKGEIRENVERTVGRETLGLGGRLVGGRFGARLCGGGGSS